MTHHEDINIPKINKFKTFNKILAILIVPGFIIGIPIVYGQGIDSETLLSAGIALAGLLYVVFFIIERKQP